MLVGSGTDRLPHKYRACVRACMHAHVHTYMKEQTSEKSAEIQRERGTGEVGADLSA